MKTIIYFLTLGFFLSVIYMGCETENDKSSKQLIQGRLIKKSSCLAEKSDTVFLLISDTLSCANYIYDSLSNTLLIEHFNAGFNCCPDSIYSSISATNDTITINELESNQLCNCSCLYNLDFEIVGVEAKSYVIKFVEPYRGNQEQLIFEVNLLHQTQGNQCVTRKEYPWGK